MHYVPRLLNVHNAFRALAPLLQSEVQDFALTKKVEHFLYRACCVIAALSNMDRAAGESVRFARSYLRQISFPPDRKIALSTEPLFEIYAQIPSALSHIVSMQNLLLPILQGALKVKASVPSSLRTAIKKGIENYGFSDYVAQVLVDYWESSGALVRGFRDLNEHFVALVDHTYFTYECDPGQILILLPDNPEEKSPEKFTYEQCIDAFATISKSLRELDEILTQMLAPLKLGTCNFDQSLGLDHIGPWGPPQDRTLGLMIEITKIEEKPEGRRIELRTIEVMQVIPKDENSGNVGIRMLKPDSEVFKD